MTKQLCSQCGREHECLSTPCADEIRAALAKVLASRHFVDSPICREHLRYSGDKRLRGDAPETFSEADVFVELIAPKRPELLSIIDLHIHRIVGARHCRTKLRLRGYYAGAGANERVEIYFEKGSLCPFFRYRFPQPQTPDDDDPGTGGAPALPLPPPVTPQPLHSNVSVSR